MGLAAMGVPRYGFPEIELCEGGYRVQMPGEDKPTRMIGWMRRFEEVLRASFAANEFRTDSSTGLIKASARRSCLTCAMGLRPRGLCWNGQ